MSGGGEVYFEYLVVGRFMKVAAIDATTGIEVAVTGPSTAGRAALEALALKKLRLRLEREAV
jgi:hypothetical protein